MKKQLKHLGGNVLHVKQIERNGVQVGIVEGYIATWDVDRGDWTGVQDQFKKGAFVESILEHVQKRRQVRLKDHHGRTVGGFPIEFVKEDERGLYGVGEINLEVQQGREAYALAKQGVLSDFSIGFSVVDFEMDGNLRTITKAIIWEGSIVDEPMNPHANITQVKTIDDEGNEMNYYESEDVKNWGKRELEKALREGSQFSKNAAKTIISLNIWTDKDEEENDEPTEEQKAALAAQAAEDEKFDAILAEIKGLSKAVGASLPNNDG